MPGKGEVPPKGAPGGQLQLRQMGDMSADLRAPCRACFSLCRLPSSELPLAHSPLGSRAGAPASHSANICRSPSVRVPAASFARARTRSNRFRSGPPSPRRLGQHPRCRCMYSSTSIKTLSCGSLPCDWLRSGSFPASHSANSGRRCSGTWSAVSLARSRSRSHLWRSASVSPRRLGHAPLVHSHVLLDRAQGLLHLLRR